MIPKHDTDTHNDCLNLERVMFDAVLHEWRRNIGSIRKPIYRPLCTYVRKMVHGRIRTNFDLHYVNPSMTDGSTADVAFYTLKYMMKPSDRSVRLQQALHMNLPLDEYNEIWSLVRPRHFESNALGYGVSDTSNSASMAAYHKVIEHLRKGIAASKHEVPGSDPMPLYFSPVDGKAAPLAKYYKNNPLVFDMQDFLDFFYASKTDADNVIVHDDQSLSQMLLKEQKFNEQTNIVLERQSVDELDDMFDPLSTFYDTLE